MADNELQSKELEKGDNVHFPLEARVIQRENVVYNEDCMEGMKQYGDNFFDLAIVDPPYGTINVNNRANNYKEYKNIEPTEQYWNEVKRVSKNLIAFGVNYYNNVELKGGRIIWNKLGRDIGRRKQAKNMSEAEVMYQSVNNLTKMYSYTWLGNVTGHNYEINAHEFKRRIHVSQKPISLYDWLIENYAGDCETILDTHVGSGSSRIAAHKAGKTFVGYEIDEDYWQAQEKRFKEFKSQLTLALN